MAEVTVEINGRRHQLACDDGQEEHVRNLGIYVDGKVQHMAQQIGQVGEPRLLLMACLMIADELHEARDGGDRGRSPAAAGAGEDKAAAALESVADRLHDIAARLEAS